jgi:exopolysaccharide production protein ExoQ
MKEIILSSPLITAFVLLIFIIYAGVIFHYASRDRKLVSNLEKIILGVFIISISGTTGAGMSPFDKLTPHILTLQATTLPTIVGQFSFYIVAFFLLLSRIRYTIKDFIEVLANLLLKAPFLCSLVLFSLFSFSWSNDPILTIKTTLVYLEVSLFAVYVGKQFSWKELYPFWRWINIIVVILSVYQAVKGNQEPWMGILGHKNQFSFFMAQTAILWLMYAVYSPKQRRLSLAFVVLSVVALNKGGSGASKVLTVAMLGLWGYFGFLKKLPVKWAIVSVILFMILSVGLTILVTENIEFIVVDTLNKDLTLTGRTDFWPKIISKINQRPLFGYGIAGFWQPWRGAADPSSDIIVAKTQFHPPHSHNGFLDLGLELGWLGLSLYILSFFNNLVKAVVYLSRNHLPESGLPLLVLTYSLMTNMTETGLVGVTSVWFWYVVTTVRLTLDMSGKTSGENKRSLASSSLHLKTD